MFRNVAIIIGSVFWGGCAVSTGLKVNELPKLYGDAAVVYIFYPETQALNTGINSSVIYVNNEKIARLDENLFTRVQLEPGRYVFTTSTDWQIACHGQLFPDFKWPPIELIAK